MELTKKEGTYILFEHGCTIATSDPKSPFKKTLSNLNCDEIFGVLDAKKFAKEDWENSGWTQSFREEMEEDFIKIYDGAFNKAISLNEDKSFTRADIIHALTYGVREGKLGRTHAEILEEYKNTHIEKEIEVKIAFDVDNILILKRI
jgi:aspartyl/asparaginyl beta-hydroxylase (cupin superfamily)